MNCARPVAQRKTCSGSSAFAKATSDIAAAFTDACRGAKPLGEDQRLKRVSQTAMPLTDVSERAVAVSHAIVASRRSGKQERAGSPRGKAPRIRLDCRSLCSYEMPVSAWIPKKCTTRSNVRRAHRRCMRRSLAGSSRRSGARTRVRSRRHHPRRGQRSIVSCSTRRIARRGLVVCFKGGVLGVAAIGLLGWFMRTPPPRKSE